MGYDKQLDAFVLPVPPKNPEVFTEVSFILNQKVDEIGEHIIREIIKDGFSRYISFHASSVRIKEL